VFFSARDIQIVEGRQMKKHCNSSHVSQNRTERPTQCVVTQLIDVHASKPHRVSCFVELSTYIDVCVPLYKHRPSARLHHALVLRYINNTD